MIEKICPVHHVPVCAEKCSKDGCDARPVISTTVYWCKECNVPSFFDTCHVCNSECDYIATDLRPVFPEEKLLISILMGLDNPLALEDKSVWNTNSGYVIDGKRKPLSMKEIKSLPLEKVSEIKKQYDEYCDKINYSKFNDIISRFIKVNEERYYAITDEAISYIQSFRDKYTIDT